MGKLVYESTLVHSSNRKSIVRVYEQTPDKKNKYITKTYDVHMKIGEAQTFEQAIELIERRSFLEHKKFVED